MMEGTLLPAWLVVPACALLMLLVAFHLMRVAQKPGTPPSRRRIRIANTMLLLAIVPLLAIGLSLINPDEQPRRMAFVWTTTIALLGMSIGLACLDILNTVRIFHRRRSRLRRHLRALQEDSTVGQEAAHE